MMRTIRPPESKQTTTLQVAVRCRPLTTKEKMRSRDILRVVDDKVVVVLDPDVSKEYLDRVQGRSKEKRYAYDVAFGADSTNEDVYKVTVGSMVDGVVRGLNATIFAYGATGSGKTHTMAGTSDDPGLMVLSLQAIFALIMKQEIEYEFEVTCSYLEVYNEVIYDLLERSSGHLELREDPDQGITVAGLKRIQVTTAEKILELLTQGNARRKTESTDANATSSRSHAVLEIIVKRKQRNQYRSQILRGKLALVDLAGSERASETNNAGQKLRDGANINKSLLALANCINALGKQQKKGLAYVPYRNSKLTRLLKDGLSGNSRTVMVATVSSSADQYHHTTNTLKYADRAKEIKTHIQTNVGTVDAHVADYQRMIDNLQVEVSQLRRQLADKESQLSARTPEKEKSADDELSWLDVLSHDINENVEERINLQKALFELEDMNLHNRSELQQLDELIANQDESDKNSEKEEELIERRQVVLDNIRDNDEAGTHYRQDIEHNEAQRKELQQHIDEAIDSDRNKTFLRILSQYRLLGMTNMELQFQMAIRDQIINDQREALSNLWSVIECSGLNHDQILEIAAQQGIMVEEGIMPSLVVGAGRTHGRTTPIPILHKLQPPNLVASTSTKFSNLQGLQNSSDAHTIIPEYRARGSKHGRDEIDTTECSPKTPNGSTQENGGVHIGGSPSRAPKGAPETLRVEGVRICHANGDAFVGDKHKGCQVPWVAENVCSSKIGGPSQDQYNVGGHNNANGATQLKNATSISRVKRRPRSAECVQLQWSRERDGTSSVGVDAGSEGNDSEDSDHCWNEERQPNDRAPPLESGSHQAIDNELLRRELWRLDSELQDLKRGIDRNNNTILYNNPKTHVTTGPNSDASASTNNNKELRRTSVNLIELTDTKDLRHTLAPTDTSDLKEVRRGSSRMTSCLPSFNVIKVSPNGNATTNGGSHMHPGYTIATPPTWKVGNVELGVGLADIGTTNSKGIINLGPLDLNDLGHNALGNKVLKGVGERRKPSNKVQNHCGPASRQTWQRNMTEWK